VADGSLTLYERHDRQGANYLTASMVGGTGDLRLVQQLLGSGEYERNVSVPADQVPALAAMLGGSPEDDVLGLLHQRYADGTFVGPRTGPLEAAMTAAGVTFETFTWVS
jgi:hypothetical protein